MYPLYPFLVNVCTEASKALSLIPGKGLR